ncbi:MAG: DinB family protein [Bacteroidota bacterium]|nr:DinB family protein [Bacteroidota bacterium]MDP4246900.1 DinB family protein [Bacteroidota bacterium]MDP4253118.1 DinB family protein [Bacteroidota bacterium]MDP4259014.1 DinB family protein [Bacteroidota bacterium]
MSHDELYVKMALISWDAHVKRIDALLAALGDEQWQQEISPGRNRGIYLLGHLMVVHDDMAELLGLGEKRHPGLQAVFLTNPDNKSGKDMPPVATLRQYWSDANARLADHFKSMTTGDWFSQHTRMSADDFVKEPHRNKLSVLLSRTSHMAYHHGQLVLLRK